MKELQNGITSLLPQAVRAKVEPESCPPWLRRPGRAECAGMWDAVSAIYNQLTGLILPKQAPSRERRSLDVLLTFDNGQQQIVEVDEKQHFTAARAVTLERYPAGVKLGFDAAAWLARSRELAGREPGGGFAKSKPPLFPGDGGRHRQRAFRDALADLLPAEHGWLPTLRVSDREVIAIVRSAEPVTALKFALSQRGASLEHLTALESGVRGL